ncbi:MAG: integration host factor subunit alpha [Deltaproteobacteria bacterium]|nr:integration host factor subunit alpha [Deltaproteobacteria bacterium]
MTVNKAHLSSVICNRLDVPNGQASHLLESLLAKIKGTLASGEDVLISGFGKFSVKEKNERRGRNPQTGDDLMLDGRRVVRFRPSSVLREKINWDS